MFTRTRSKKRRSGGAPFCRLCSAEVRVDLLGQCRLGHQTVDVPFSATSGPAVLDASTVDDDADDASLVGVAVAEPLPEHAEAPLGDADPAWADETVVHDPIGPSEVEDLYGATHWVHDPAPAEPLEEITAAATEGLWSAPTFGLQPPVDEHPVAGAPAASSWQDDFAPRDSEVVTRADEHGADESVADEQTGTALAVAAGGVAADAARQRLLEAASWFAASEDDATR